MQLSIHSKYRTNEFAGYGWHILDGLGCFCTILATCDQMRQLQTAGTVDHEIVSVPIATAYSLKSVSLRLIMGFEKFSGFIVNLKFLAVFIHLLLFSQWL
jgi:hypothetical protein